MTTVELTLPVSQKKVVIRNYVTIEDDEVAEAIMYQGVNNNMDEDGKLQLEFPVANVMASQKSYIYRLVQTIDGQSGDVKELMKQLPAADYPAIEEAVNQIIEEHSPKAKGAKNASSSKTK